MTMMRRISRAELRAFSRRQRTNQGACRGGFQTRPYRQTPLARYSLNHLPIAKDYSRCKRACDPTHSRCDRRTRRCASSRYVFAAPGRAGLKPAPTCIPVRAQRDDHVCCLDFLEAGQEALSVLFRRRAWSAVEMSVGACPPLRRPWPSQSLRRRSLLPKST